MGQKCKAYRSAWRNGAFQTAKRAMASRKTAPTAKRWPPGGWGTATRKHDGNDRTKKLYAGKGIRKQNTIQINQTYNDTEQRIKDIRGRPPRTRGVGHMEQPRAARLPQPGGPLTQGTRPYGPSCRKEILRRRASRRRGAGRGVRWGHHGQLAVQGRLHHAEHENTVQRDKRGLCTRGEETAIPRLYVHLSQGCATADARRRPANIAP